MNIKSILAVLAALVMAAGTSQAADVTWRLGSSVGPKDTTTLQLEDLAKRVGQKSGGRFKIDVIPIETIGFKNVDSLRVLKQGVVRR